MHNLLNHLAVRHDVVFFAEQFKEVFIGHGGAGSPFCRSVPAAAGLARYVSEVYANPVSRGLRSFAEASPVRAPVLSGLALSMSRPRRWRELLRWADVIQVEFPWQFAPTRRHAGLKPVVYASHNVEAHKFCTYPEVKNAPLLSSPLLSWIEAMEGHAVREADLVVAVSPEDREGFVNRYHVDPARIVVAPNAADADRYRPVDPAGRRRVRRSLGLPERPTILFLGSNHPPNVAAMHWVRQLAAMMPGCTFLVVGNVAASGVEGSIIRTGMVDDLAPYLAAADVSLVPIEFGAGTKIKLLESCSAGLPVLAFPEAIAGTLFRHGQHLTVVDKRLDALASGLGELLEDPARAASLGQAARALVEQCYDWRASAAQLEGALTGLLRSSHP
jgi:glycosyltransferase involved in cell wall biosynthesis